jgi:hypothetical protein
MYLSERSVRLLIIGLAVFASFEVFTGLYFMSGLGMALFAGIAVKFVQDLGKRIEIRDLISFMSVLQWVVGPILAYNYLPYDDLYYMAVPEEVYMDFVVPACYFMAIGLYFPLRDERIINHEDIDRMKTYLGEYPYIGYVLAAIGLAAGFASKMLPPSLRFIGFLLTNLQYVGVYMILFGNGKFKWLVFAGIMGLAASAAVLQGMFGELVQWLMLSFLIIAMVVQIPMWGKVSIIVVGLMLMLLIQSTKQEYRMATWYAESTKSNSQIYNEIIASRLSNPGQLFNTEVLGNMGARLNQGWIIARIMGYMPEKTPYVRGETVKKALYASLLPRFLVPSKARAGGRANFERFTGTPLPESTSMDISLVGEGYANFGPYGGIVFLFLVSLFYNWVIIFVIQLAKKNPTLVIWIPFLFFQVMKAETDFATVFNYLTKASVIAFAVFYATKQVLILLETKPKIVQLQ